MIAVPMAKKTSRAHPRISPTIFDSVVLPVSGAETCSTSGSVVIECYWKDPLHKNGTVILAHSADHFQPQKCTKDIEITLFLNLCAFFVAIPPIHSGSGRRQRLLQFQLSRLRLQVRPGERNFYPLQPVLRGSSRLQGQPDTVPVNR